MALKRKGPNISDRGISTEEWIEVAKTTLIEEGVDGVKIDRLAKKSGVTRGGFYYRFKSREALLDALLDDWKVTNNTPWLIALRGPGSHVDRYRAFIQLLLDEKDYRPDYDVSIRNWSRESAKVAAAVHEIDDIRIDALNQIFLDAGYDEEESLVRARVSYFHQVGYYAMGVRETSKRRAELSEVYYRVLTGFRDGEIKTFLRPSEPAPSASPQTRAVRVRRP